MDYVDKYLELVDVRLKSETISGRRQPLTLAFKTLLKFLRITNMIVTGEILLNYKKIEHVPNNID